LPWLGIKKTDKRGKEDGKNPGDKPNIDIVVLDAFDLGQKGKRCGMAEETDVLNSLQRKL
jgi:hypothetical protein